MWRSCVCSAHATCNMRLNAFLCVFVVMFVCVHTYINILITESFTGALSLAFRHTHTYKLHINICYIYITYIHVFTYGCRINCMLVYMIYIYICVCVGIFVCALAWQYISTADDTVACVTWPGAVRWRLAGVSACQLIVHWTRWNKLHLPPWRWHVLSMQQRWRERNDAPNLLSIYVARCTLLWCCMH